MSTVATDDPTRTAATLSRVVDGLAGIATLVAAPNGMDVDVAHTYIHDVSQDDHLEAGDIILGVGAAGMAATTLVERAGAAGAAAVVLKLGDEEPPELVAAAEAAGVAVLSVPTELTWAQLHGLVRTLLAGAGEESDADRSSAYPIGDLFALANAVSAMVGGPATIEDPQSRVLAYSSTAEALDDARRETILGRRVPRGLVDRLRAGGVFRKLYASEEPIRVDGFIEEDGTVVHSRLAVAVRAGQEVLGSIWVAEPEPIGEVGIDALRQAARIAALHLVRHRSGDDLERRLRGDLLRSILEGRGPIHAAADRLGLETEGTYAVIAFAIGASDDAELALLRQRALDLVRLHCEAYRRRAAEVPIGDTIYALVPLREADSLEGLRRLAADIEQRASAALHTFLHVGIGSTVPHLRDVPRSRADADLVLRVLAQRRRGGEADAPRVASIDDVRPAAMLLELRTFAEQRPDLVRGKVTVLAESDADRGTEYLPTLRCYFDSFGDVPNAAAQMEVHPNTFRYRLRRLCEVADLDLGDPEDRLAAELELRLRWPTSETGTLGT